MARRPDIAGSDARQPELPLDDAPPGSLLFDAEFRAALAKAIADSGKPREAIAIEMERLLGSDPDYPVSRALLDAWTAPSRTTHRFPAIYLPAFVRATGAAWLFDVIVGKSGRRAITPVESAHAELGRALADRDRADAEIRRLRRLAGGRR